MPTRTFLSLSAFAASLGVSASPLPIWPPPSTLTQTGPMALVSPDLNFVVVANVNSNVGDIDASRLQSAASRAVGLLQQRAKTGLKSKKFDEKFEEKFDEKKFNEKFDGVVESIKIEVGGGNSVDGVVNVDTDYSYKLTINATAGTAIATAPSVYGAMYALESLVQLADHETGAFPHSQVVVEDAPQYSWRGLMVDSGRRFFPVPLLHNLMDTMAAVKMNVLHLHASDMCRFGVESKVHPELTEALTGIHAGFYTQEDITALEQYANGKGIRLVPEFDVPGHSRGFRPVKGIDFCTTDESQNQLFGSNATYDIVHDVLKEMSGLFSDDVFNIGCDETAAKGVCTVESTFAFERKLFQAIATEFGKTPEGWEEAYFDAGAATNDTIVNAWTRHTASEIVAKGFKAVESKSSAFYFTQAGPAGPAGWERCWYDIATGIKDPDQLKLLLGGEISMWSDTYCYINQCGAFGSGSPVGAKLFDPALDTEFGKSIGGMIWPRGYVAAAAFYNYNTTADPSSPSFVSAITALNDDLASRGSLVCPTNCSCDQLTACGEPYVKPTVGNNLTMQACSLPESNSTQGFTLTSEGKLQLSSSPDLCVTQTTPSSYPLQLTPCTTSTTTWERKATLGEIVETSTGECFDVRENDGFVGTWTCGSGSGLDQTNQHFAFDESEGLIISLDTGKSWAGQCVTASS